ncbi:MAG: acetylglutamate kinase [Candidatus Fibromonas sp.]|jgi:acetylglutamate kinase|nr:acetylglutamate kinase [Candidatus Fibromonas sp.]
MKTIVVKIGGSLAVDESKLLDFASAAAEISGEFRLAIVHGGGKDINANLALLNEEPKFIDGLRVTTPAIMDMVEMTLSGKVNKKLVRMLLSGNANAAGISGVDAKLLEARPLQGKGDLGAVGDIFKVNTQILETFFSAGITPVISPVSYGGGISYNVNADTAASEIAVALKADCFVLISDISGVLNENKEIIPHLNGELANNLIQSGVISGGMIPKVRGALESIERGLKSIHIVGWEGANIFKNQIAGTGNSGTIVSM